MSRNTESPFPSHVSVRSWKSALGAFVPFARRPASQRQRTDMIVLAHIKEQSRLSLGSYGHPTATLLDATRSFDLFIESYEAKYPRAVEFLMRDRVELLRFFDFPAQHWQSIRTSNPIESAFATIRHRTKRTKGSLSRDGILHMMFKLGQCAEKNWRKLRGFT